MAEQIVPTRTYYSVFAILVLCTYLTVQISYFDLGRLNAVAALGIAVFKAVLVVLFFMHVKYSTHLTWVVIAAGIFWFGIMVSITMADYLTRSWQPY
jgi:cytochrome c oxidase subunit 4